MVPGWIVIVSFTMAMIGATVENVSTMPNRRRMMFCGLKICFYTIVSVHRIVRSFHLNMDAVFSHADAICNMRAPHTCTAPSNYLVSMQLFNRSAPFTARTVRTRRAVGKNPIDEVNLEWIFACNL